MYLFSPASLAYAYFHVPEPTHAHTQTTYTLSLSSYFRVPEPRLRPGEHEDGGQRGGVRVEQLLGHGGRWSGYGRGVPYLR